MFNKQNGRQETSRRDHTTSSLACRKSFRSTSGVGFLCFLLIYLMVSLFLFFSIYFLFYLVTYLTAIPRPPSLTQEHCMSFSFLFVDSEQLLCPQPILFKNHRLYINAQLCVSINIFCDFLNKNKWSNLLEFSFSGRWMA